MYPQPQIHRRIQGQRLSFHFNSLATQSQPCERRQVCEVHRESLRCLCFNIKKQLQMSFVVVVVVVVVVFLQWIRKEVKNSQGTL